MPPSEKLRQALDLMEFGFAMQRQKLRRRHPTWTEEQVERAFRAWLGDRPSDYTPGPGE